MKYVGLQTQIWNNNFRSTILLFMFPLVILALAWLFFYFTRPGYQTVNEVNMTFIGVAPWLIAGVLIWFLIAWYANTSMIRRATGAKPLERKDNKRVYNLVENLCIAAGMKTPQNKHHRRPLA
jgi:heat shock protein HtpX